MLKNFEILAASNMDMEEYLSLYHLYTEHKNLLNAESQIMVDEYLKIAFNTVISKIVLLRDAELFLIETPYLIKHGMDREIIKKLSLKYYDIAESKFLENKLFNAASILRANKKWFDML